MKTKVFATLGPSFNTREMLQEAVSFGVTGFRINLSHGNLVDFKPWFESLKGLKDIEIIIDMQGPELRLGNLEEPLRVCKDETIAFGKLPMDEEIRKHLALNAVFYLDDGKIGLRVVENGYLCLNDGVIQSRKSIRIDGCDRFLPILASRDIENISVAKEYGITGIMCPFIENERDINELRKCLSNYDCDLKVYSKIEDLKGFENLEAISEKSDVVVIARGDLGNACGLTRLPYIQRKITDYCTSANKPFMVVTQMLDSMINNPYPTRAEVNDVFMAVLSGAEYIMLTGETAAGKHPLLALKTMVEIAKNAEEYINEQKRQ